jgi:hypothetical protein
MLELVRLANQTDNDDDECEFTNSCKLSVTLTMTDIL